MMSGGAPTIGLTVPAPASNPGMMSPSAPPQAMTPASGQAPISPEKLKLLELPTWEEVEALLKNPVLREFRLDIETDSTIRMDEEAEKKARIELISTVSDFMQQMVQAGMTAPEILPMLGELLMFGIRAFKTARSVEQTFDDMMQSLEKAAKAPKPPPPELLKVQAQAQADMQVEQARAKTDIQIAQAKSQADIAKDNAAMHADMHEKEVEAQLEARKHEIDAHREMVIQDLKNSFEAERIRWETAAKERIANIEAEHAERLEGTRLEHERETRRREMSHESSMKDKDRTHESKLAEKSREHEEKLAKNTPKKGAD